LIFKYYVMQGIIESSAQTSEPILIKAAEPRVPTAMLVTHPDPAQAYSGIEDEAKGMTGKIMGLFGI
jgi:hypothetical protein